MKEIQQLGNHGEEANQKITELEALCKPKEDAAKKLTEEEAKLEGMIQSRDVLMGENDNNGTDATTPPVDVPPHVPASPVAAPKVIVIEEEENPVEMVPK
jgi:hypothetical protein